MASDKADSHWEKVFCLSFCSMRELRYIESKIFNSCPTICPHLYLRGTKMGWTLPEHKNKKINKKNLTPNSICVGKGILKINNCK